jgi:integrase
VRRAGCASTAARRGNDARTDEGRRIATDAPAVAFSSVVRGIVRRQEVTMPGDRVTVYVLRPKDRATMQLQWVDPDTGKRKSRSAKTTDEKAAEQARAGLEYELNNGRYQEASRMTWERFRESFEEEYAAQRRADTRRNYRVAFDLFESVCAPKALRSVTERTLSAFAAGLLRGKGRGCKADGRMASTVRVRLQFLRTALRWAAEQKLIPEVPKFPSVKVPRKKPQPVPAESFERLLAKAPDPQTRAFLLCGWLAGLRLKEAFELRWEEAELAPYLDLSRDRVVFPAEFVKAVEDQWVPLDPDLRKALLALPRRGAKVFHFPKERGEGEADANAVAHRIAHIARAARVRLTMKSLRRGFGCRYAARVPAQVLQKLMRHSNIAITMAYYANVDDAVMEAVLGPRPNKLPNTARGITMPADESSPETVAGTGASDDASSRPSP